MRTLRSIQYFLLALVILAVPATSRAQFSASITVAPPALVVYAQPACPQQGYLWTPGYWAYGDEGYFWVPGTWVEPPSVGLLWTPGYWGWNNNMYAWNGGYWGNQVGFYGGVNYGYGYGGSGYQGGYWRNNQFSYNRSVNNFGGRNFSNTYDRRVSVSTSSHVSYNGGHGGISARPTAAQETFAHASHTSATAAQTSHQQAARGNREMLASVNHGRPAVAATSKPGEFSGNGVVAARGATAASRANETKANENKTEANKAAETKATENKAAENKAAENRTAETRATANKAEANKSAETKATENRAAASKASENKAAENKATENNAAASRAAANKTKENNAAAARSNENKAAENKRGCKTGKDGTRSGGAAQHGTSCSASRKVRDASPGSQTRSREAGSGCKVRTSACSCTQRKRAESGSPATTSSCSATAPSGATATSSRPTTTPAGRASAEGPSSTYERRETQIIPLPRRPKGLAGLIPALPVSGS